MKSKLQIGILLDSFLICAWTYKMLEEIRTNSDCEITLIVKSKAEKAGKTKLLSRIKKNHKEILFKLYEKIDRKLFKCIPDAFEEKDIRDLISTFSTERVPKTIEIDDLNDEFDLNRLAKWDIDIYINLGSVNPQGKILKMAHYGVWNLIHSDIKIIKGDQFGIWEIIQERDETGATLQILSDNPNDTIVLGKSYSSTHSYSQNKNKNNYYWKALSFIPEKIKELCTLGDELFFNRTHDLNKHLQFYSNKQLTTPTNKEMISFGFRLVSQTIKNKIEKIFYFYQWILLFKLSPSISISKEFYQFEKILPPKDRFWADPFIIRRNNKYYIFIEELIYRENKGCISLIIMDDNGKWTKPVKVLEKDYHLSYPFLIEDNGELYMIPETENNSTIELYKCVDFPLKWELEKTLMDNIIASDSTIIHKDEKYWLFTNVIKNKGSSSHDELFLFSSDSLNSDEWISHPQNPIITDVRSSRQAGKFFTHNNKLYRPSQDCAKHYGHGIKINEVIELNSTIYKEKVVDSIYSNWDKDLNSTHTINSVEKLTMIDAKMKRRKLFSKP